MKAAQHQSIGVDHSRQRIRRNALILGSLALAFYFGFICLAVMGSP